MQKRCQHCDKKAVAKVSLYDPALQTEFRVDHFFCMQHYNMRAKGEGLDFLIETTFLKGV